jgi:hypothetical protein
MRTFNISDMIPLEDEPRDYSLRFLTQIWRNFGTFSVLDPINNGVPPYVYSFGGFHYLDDGNHRCIWRLLNGIEKIDAEEEFPDLERQRSTLITVESVHSRGIFTIGDLVKRVKNPENYSSEGPITHIITLEDLQTPGYFLRI